MCSLIIHPKFSKFLHRKEILILVWSAYDLSLFNLTNFVDNEIIMTNLIDCIIYITIKKNIIHYVEWKKKNK